MNTITVSDIRTKGSKAIKSDSPTFLIVNSKVNSVIISPEMYEEFIEAMEELEDIKAIEEYQNNKGKTIPADEFWNLVEKDLKDVQNRVPIKSKKRS